MTITILGTLSRFRIQITQTGTNSSSKSPAIAYQLFHIKNRNCSVSIIIGLAEIIFVAIQIDDNPPAHRTYIVFLSYTGQPAHAMITFCLLAGTSLY